MSKQNFVVEAGSISLWTKTAANGTKYLNGNIELDDSFDLADKYYLSLFKNDGEGKAIMKGKITERGEDGNYVTLAYVSLFKNEGKGEHHLYGYINVNKKALEAGQVSPNLNFSLKLYRNQLEPGSKKPLYTGDVYEVVAEQAKTVPVKKSVRSNDAVFDTYGEVDDIAF
jgi:hypothetical protein